MADQGYIATPNMIFPSVKTTGPDAVVAVIKPHSVCATYQQSRFVDFVFDTLLQPGCGVVLDNELGHDRRRAGTMGNDILECGFQAVVTNGKYDVVDRFR